MHTVPLGAGISLSRDIFFASLWDEVIFPEVKFFCEGVAIAIYVQNGLQNLLATSRHNIFHKRKIVQASVRASSRV